jgi:NAD(P)H-dependent flavin oxidoreductase YrpB (nitropropane dioxygenase family)
MLSTKVTKKLGMTYPVFSAGMARVSQAPLVAAVSDAGGMGCLGGVSFMPDALREEIREIRRRTDKPFAVNLVVPKVFLESGESKEWADIQAIYESLSEPEQRKLHGVKPMLTKGAIIDQLHVVLDERPAVVVLTFDIPKEVVDACKQRGMSIMALCGSVGSARNAAASGADFIVAQGSEGGGHTGYVGTMALIPSVVDAVDVPVIAAGGIVDGRGLAAALCLGAEAAWCGTRFIATPEAFGHDAFKARVMHSASKDTTLTKSYTGKNLRTLRNSWTENWEASPNKKSAAFPAQYAVAGHRVESGYLDGDVDEGMMPCGQGVSGVNDIQPAGEIVRRMASDAEAILNARRNG